MSESFKYNREIQSKVAGTFLNIMLPIMAIAVLPPLVIAFFQYVPPQRLIITVIVYIVIGVTYLIRHKAGDRFAVSFLLIGISLLQTTAVFLNGGFQAPAMGAMLVLVALFGWYFSSFVTIAFSLFVIGLGGVITILNSQGMLPRPPIPQDSFYLMNYISYVTILAIGIVTANKHLHKAVADLTENEKTVTKALHDLQESRNFTVQAVDHSRELFGWLTPNGVLQFANETALSMVGVKSEDVIGKLFWDTQWFNHSESEQKKLRDAVAIAASGESVQYNAYHITETGICRTVEFKLTPTKDLAGTVTLLTAEGMDVTDRVQAEKALKSLSTSYAHLAGKSFYEAVTAHIAQQFTIDFLFVGKLNRSEQSVTVLGGFALGEPMGDLTYDLADTPCSNVMDRGTCVFPNSICQLYPKDLLLQQMNIEGYVGSIVKGKDGTPIGILVALHRTQITQTEELTSMFQIFLDRVSAEMQRGISEEALALEMLAKEKLTEQLHQSQKMEAVGQLAGGVAHDFNNALGGIIGAADLLKSGEFSQEEQKEFLDLILSAGERAADLTKKLLLFSRKGSKASSAVDCFKIVNDTASLLKHTINKNITISVENRAIQTSVIGDDSLLQNALMNMGINASHAMPNGGELTFTLENLELDDEYCAMSPFEIKLGDYLEISIRDTGTGMSPEIQSRIFEPFFTTKEAGKGTGLGMAAVYGTVLEHGGAITVYSEVGAGTVFRVYMPVTAETVKREIEQETIPVGSGTILVIDDEELIRITASAMLRSLGYRVILATNGLDGVNTFAETKDEIDLIILDMIMPVMGGREAFTKLREIDPTIPVIIASGFAKEEDMAALKKEGVNGFLNKPFRRAELAEKVAGAIKTQRSK